MTVFSIHSRRWRRHSLAYRRAHPLCELCEADGFTVASDEVDHIIPRSDGGAIWDERNLQALCRGHHIAKTRTDGGVVSVAVDEDGTVVSGPLSQHPAQRPGITAQEAGEA